MQSKLLRHGHSNAVIIPAPFLKKLSLKKGDRVEMRFDYEAARVVLSFPDARQLRLAVETRPKKSHRPSGAATIGGAGPS